MWRICPLEMESKLEKAIEEHKSSPRGPLLATLKTIVIVAIPMNIKRLDKN
jgi:hypothetical protein